MRELADHKRIDYSGDSNAADPRFSTDYLFGEARGHMFGVLECKDHKGESILLRAFSGQYNSVWLCEGWVPPVFDTTAYDRIVIPGDLAIKELGRKMDALDPDSVAWAELRQERKRLSQGTMKKIHQLYELENFRGETRPLAEFFKPGNGPPTGAGDCCAPKLLNHAVQNDLRPLGMAEFYWGKTNRSETRTQGRFYASCVSKCQPILGFMLCGVGE
jgi:hypothetical protein